MLLDNPRDITVSSADTGLCHPDTDSRVPDQAPTAPQLGMGKCTIYRCKCPAYVGLMDVCARGGCGHRYAFHN
jgi:hypothetical protein